jgi:Leucine-rich repeat (LRR) protein
MLLNITHGLPHPNRTQLINDYSGDYSGDELYIIHSPKNKSPKHKDHKQKQKQNQNQISAYNTNKIETNKNNMVIGITGGIMCIAVVSLLGIKRYRKKKGHKLIDNSNNYTNYNTLVD